MKPNTTKLCGELIGLYWRDGGRRMPDAQSPPTWCRQPQTHAPTGGRQATKRPPRCHSPRLAVASTRAPNSGTADSLHPVRPEIRTIMFPWNKKSVYFSE